jgi:2-polyprenyl-3-methyl-5-hydroxy-6-metoxy-1,4-benzoquinol methylase
MHVTPAEIPMTIQSQKLEVREKFDSQQKHWEDMYHKSDYESRGHQWRQDSGIVLLRTFLPNGGRILDVGCGCGHASTALAQFGYQVIGLDISENMISQARRNAQSMDLGENCAFRAADFEKEWLTLERFDGILALGFIEYFDDPVCVLRSFFDLLKPGGIAAVQIWNSRSLPDLLFEPVVQLGSLAHRALPEIIIRMVRLPTPATTTAVKDVVHRRYSPRRLERFAAEAGLKLVGSSGSRYFSNRHFPAEGFKLRHETTMQRIASRNTWFRRLAIDYVAALQKP